MTRENRVGRGIDTFDKVKRLGVDCEEGEVGENGSMQ